MSGGVFVTKQQQSYSGDAIKITTYADDYATRGNAFQVQKRFQLTTGATTYFEFNLPAAAGKFIYTLPLTCNVYGGGITLDTYLADSSTGGSAISVVKVSDVMSTSNLITVKSGVTVSGTPTNLREYLFGSSGLAGTGGGVGARSTPKIWGTSKPLYFKFTNLENSTVTVSLGFTWYEI